MVLEKYRKLLCGAAMAALLCGQIAPISAQTPPALSKEAKENNDLMEAWADLGTLRVVTPLKLTDEQIDKLIALITASETEHNQKLVLMFNESLKKVAPDIRAAKQKALKGEAISEEMAEKLKKGMETHLDNIGPKKQEDVALATLKALAPKVKAILNAAQVATASKIAHEEQEKLAKGSKGTDAQWFNLYVQKVIMGYPRIVPILKELKGAGTASTATDAKDKS